jgi:hypothetical protein
VLCCARIAGRCKGLRYPNGSLAAHLQQALPETRVVKTRNTMHNRLTVTWDGALLHCC